MFWIICIRIVDFNMYLIKTNEITLGLLEYSWAYVLMSIGIWAKVAIFTQVCVS